MIQIITFLCCVLKKYLTKYYLKEMNEEIIFQVWHHNLLYIFNMAATYIHTCIFLKYLLGNFAIKELYRNLIKYLSNDWNSQSNFNIIPWCSINLTAWTCIYLYSCTKTNTYLYSQNRCYDCYPFYLSVCHDWWHNDVKRNTICTHEPI